MEKTGQQKFIYFNCMKTKINNKLLYNRLAIMELNNNQEKDVVGGTLSEHMLPTGCVCRAITITLQ
jgi:hypothetical protein